MNLLDFVYFFTPVMAFIVAIELLHLIPYLKKLTDPAFYEKTYQIAIVVIISMLFFELSFIAELYLGSRDLHKILEIGAMGIILGETIFIIRRDIQELDLLVATNEVIKKSESQYRNLIETMNDGFWAIDDKGTTTMVNQRLSDMLGYQKEEFIGKKVSSFFDEDQQRILQKHLALRKGGKRTNYSITIRKKNGSSLPILVSGSPLFDDSGSYKGAFAIITDISKIKELEAEIRAYNQNLESIVDERTKELKAARDSVVNMLEDLTGSKAELLKAYDKLRDVDRMKTDIISNISHELRTPVTIAKSAIELTREEEDPTEISKFLTMCDNALSRLDDLVENLVDIAAVYKGKYVMSSGEINLNDVIKESLNKYKELADTRKVKLNYTRSPEDIFAQGDRRTIIKVIQNLIENAIKFNREGGDVLITVAKEPDNITIAVKDTGIGIEEKDQDRIFDSFYQVDPTSTRAYGGTGIGLALAKANVETMEGKIWVESKVGLGSTFYVSLPRSSEKDL